jgi:hypothetical protein
MFTGEDVPFGERELDGLVDEGVPVFLAAYGANRAARTTMNAASKGRNRRT